MAIGAQELKLAFRMQEWSAWIAECRRSGVSVRIWCNEQGISEKTNYRWEKRFCRERNPTQLSLPSSTQTDSFIRVNPEIMPSNQSFISVFSCRCQG